MTLIAGVAVSVFCLAEPFGVTNAAAVKRPAASVSVVASGLNNPRGLNFSPNGDLYVAEAGSGGSQLCFSSEETGDLYFGFTGSVTKIDMSTGAQTRVVTGLPSNAAEDGTGALGPHDVAFQGMGNAYVTIGFGNPPSLRTAGCPASLGMASLMRFNPSGRTTYVADLGTYEQNADPAGEGPDSDPYGLLPMGGRTIYTDAGGNALNQVAANGSISTLAIFPNMPNPLPFGPPTIDAVPTTVAQGPDGALYVGQLTGFPFPPGGANVYRVPAGGGTPTIYRSGFTNIIDIAFAPDGSMYVLEISHSSILNGFDGQLIHVSADGSQQDAVDTGFMLAPAGVAIGPDGALYITVNSILPGAGEVIRVVP
jgi:hypothetical protein